MAYKDLLMVMVGFLVVMGSTAEGMEGEPQASAMKRCELVAAILD